MQLAKLSRIRLSHSTISCARNLINARVKSARSQSTHSSVDQNEISHFDALASSWWDPNGSSRLLHLMNPIRHEFMRGCLASSPRLSPATTTGSSKDAVKTQLNGLHLLDIGCGGGIFAESAARLPNVASVTAIDPSAAVLKIADAHRRQDPMIASPIGRLAYVNCDIESLDGALEMLDIEAKKLRPEDKKFDVVSLFEVIEHVPRPSDFLEQVGAHVRPGGWLVLSTIARTWTSWAVTKVVAEDIMGIVPRGTHDWNKYINEAELRAWFQARPGWERPRAMGVVYVPGLGWKEVPGSENFGNYFFGIRKSAS
jgi:polyprenyldihydroxybenzoate methyltransferase/3-demethylubiquinol 3-O-methyltransferase